MVGGQYPHFVLEFDGGAGGADGVIRLITSGIERCHDGVAHELLYLAAKALGDERCRQPVVRAEHRGDVRLWRLLRERGEAGEVREEHAHRFGPLAGCREVELAKPFLTPLVMGRIKARPRTRSR